MNKQKQRKGYFLYSLNEVAAPLISNITVKDVISNTPVKLWENGMGGVAGDVKPGRIYKVTVTSKSGTKFGWYFHGYNFDNGYNFFSE